MPGHGCLLVAATKSCQVLALLWSAFQDSAKIVFRALGLSLIVSGLTSLRHIAIGKGFDEPTKIAIRKSRTTALMRALIHVVPVSVSLWEIIFNWNTYYMGATIRNQAYYQFGAKVHEMTAQASLSAIVFSYVRYEMSLGQGLPFGALFSGLQVSQASYLWSMEFWGSLCSNHLAARRRIGMLLVITIVIVLAATIGPSSAILLTPRLEYWPAGSTNIWINVTSQDLWPDRTDASLVRPSCLVSDPLISDGCPSSGWQAIQNYLTFSDTLLPLTYQLAYGTITPNSMEMADEHSLRHLRAYHQLPVNPGPGYDPVTAFATTQQVAIADALSTTGTLWSRAQINMSTSGHGSVLDQLDAVHSIVKDYYQPYTLASCDFDIIRGLTDSEPLAFPPPPGSIVGMLDTAAFNDSILPGGHAFVFSGITKSELLQTPGPADQNRLRWIELPQDPFNGSAIGAAVLLPRSEENSTQELLMCTIGAGWGESTLNTSTFAGSPQAMLSEVGLKPQDIKADNVSFSKQGLGIPATESLAEGGGGYFVLPLFPQRPVTITEAWAQYLNPTISTSNTTLFHHLMTSNLSAVDVSISARIILSCMTANGLSRIGSSSQLQGNVKTVVNPDGSLGLDGNYWFSGKGDAFDNIDPVASKDWVKLFVSSTFEGYAYNTRGATPKVAICFLLAYCIVAVIHILYAGITGISSTCWDSIGEVTALAVNSTPTALLRNTCAGITELGIFKIPVRVLAMRDDEQSDGEHLELVFGEVDEKTVEHKTLKANRVYGTMPMIATKSKTL